MTTFDAVLAAAERLDGVAARTPVFTSTRTDQRGNASLFLKAENLQRTGAFKFRGAYNALASLSDEKRAAGVVAFSSGNHAQALAKAASLLGVPAAIVMPTDAPAGKLAATRSYGAELVQYDRYTEDREAIAKHLAEDRGRVVVPPFDAPEIIAGQATAALELFDDVGPLDRLYVPLGGGGLLSGSAIAASVRCPDCEVIGVEPEAGNDGQRSLVAGERVTIAVPETIADGAQTTSLGLHTFDLIERLVSRIETVSDAQLIEAMVWMFHTMKLVVEPTGCLGLAAALAAEGGSGQRVGVILSGGNIDASRFGQLTQASATKPGRR